MEVLGIVAIGIAGFVVGCVGAEFIIRFLRGFRKEKDLSPVEFEQAFVAISAGQNPGREEPMKHYRQGDVLLVKIEDLPEVKRYDSSGVSQGIVRAELGTDVVLAYGEATGHAHVLDREKVEAWVRTASKEPPTKAVWDSAAERFIRVMEATSLKHLNLLKDGSPTGEHADIALDPGVYRVVRQREWTDEQERWVND